MCGILGGINWDGVGMYLDTIKHRGPDAGGAKRVMLNGNTVYLLHRRLSILDLTDAGSQPMLSFNGNACISFNGEIYNHYSLRKELGDLSFKGHSDTETIVNYIASFGIEKALTKLNGIFAFACLDKQKKVLYLVRDRFGVKPLYYYFDGSRLIFSSEIEPIRLMSGQAVDERSIMFPLRLRYTPSPDTVYTYIKKVEPGQLVTFHLNDGILMEMKYFLSPPQKLGSRSGDLLKIVNEYGDLFEKAVERQLMADVDVGVFLSGGIDSALVAAVAKKKSKKNLKAFTIGFEGNHKKIDEIVAAKETASILGLDHFYRKIPKANYLEVVKDVSLIVEEPIATTSIIPMYFLAELASSKVKVVLSGQGADEPLAGYNKYRALGLLEATRSVHNLMRLSKNLEFIYKGNEASRRLLTAMQQKDKFCSLWEFNAILSKKEALDLIKPELRDRCSMAMEINEQRIKDIWRSRSPGNIKMESLCLYNDLRTSLSDDLLMYSDKITMHFSLECRVPILDNELIEFVESLEFKYKSKGGRRKFIHREFAKAYLPSIIIEREKIGFKSPSESWFRESNGQILNMLTKNKRFIDIFDCEAIGRIFSKHNRGENLEKQILILLSLYYLLNRNQTN